MDLTDKYVTPDNCVEMLGTMVELGRKPLADIQQDADGIVAGLREGWATSLDYQPDNGTRYALVFTPLWETSGNAAGTLGVAKETGVLLSVANFGTCHPFNLYEWADFLHPLDVARYWTNGRPADGAALANLLHCIFEAWVTATVAASA